MNGSVPTFPRPASRACAFCRPSTARFALALFALLGATLRPLLAQRIAAAPPGRVETGVPSFVVFGPEAMGISGSPTGIHLLPDGRVLVTSPQEIAFGDGVRWDPYRAADGATPLYRDALVDDDGRIYFGLEGAIGRLEIGTDGMWRAKPVIPLPRTQAGRSQTLISATQVGTDWYWHTGSGDMFVWRPGRTPRVVTTPIAVERIFPFASDVYASDTASGGLYNLSRNTERIATIDHVTSELVTAQVPFDGEHILLGTNLTGLKLFDGKRFSAFGQPGPLTASNRINDLCAVGTDMFAAAIDTVGIVIFDRTGKVVQVLDSRLDHRLGRVEKIRYASSGVLWGLLNEGVVRVEFPSRVSRFEPLIASGISYASPFRYRGDLWMLADGRALRGVYDRAGRLQRFAVDNPPGKFVFTLNTVDDELFGCSDAGIYVRAGNGWKLVARDVVNARIGFAKTPAGALIYAARGEIGTLSRTAEGYVAHSVPVPGLTDNFNAVVDGQGVVWLELGTAKVGRLDPENSELQVEIFSREAGLIDGWVAAFIFEGQAHFAFPNRILRFDDATRRFVNDTALMTRFPQFLNAGSRPSVDDHGRVWYIVRGRTWSLDLHDPNATPQLHQLPFTPIEIKFQDDGVVWFWGTRHVARYDTRIPLPASTKPRVVVTSIQFPNSNRQLFDFEHIEPVPAFDNTIVFRFAAPGNPFTSPTTFEVQLEGLSEHWASVGNTGQAIFNRLKEGHYTFQVRAVTSSGVASDVARVAFTIEPPWYRSTAAWSVYVVAGLGALLFVVWYPSIRQRKENERLEHLVTKRTEQLNNTNQQLGRQIEETTEKSRALAASEERYRSLTEELEKRVEQRTAELSHSNRELKDREKQLATTYKELVDASRMAGMAEVATGVLHNVGNVLNSLNVSSNLIATTVRQSKADSFVKLSALLHEHADHLAAFLTEDPKGRRVPELLARLAETATAERDWLLGEVASMQKNIDHIKEIVAMQQSYATVLGVAETLEAAALFDDALRMNSGALSRHDVHVVKEFLPVPPVSVEKGKVLQILINIIRNAKYACDDGQKYGVKEKIITVRIEPAPGDRVRFIVRDNGIGIPPENLTRIFAHGFTTRSYGHGFGLHSSAIAAREMKGSLTVESPGVGQGATFILEIPCASIEAGAKMPAVAPATPLPGPGIA